MEAASRTHRRRRSRNLDAILSLRTLSSTELGLLNYYIAAIRAFCRLEVPALKTPSVFIRFTLPRPVRERRHARPQISDGNEEDSPNAVAAGGCRCIADCSPMQIEIGGARMRFRGKLRDACRTVVRVDAIWRIPPLG